jgi:hypothetical protein
MRIRQRNTPQIRVCSIENAASVEKRLHIHSIECAELFFLMTAHLLSSFDPSSIQGFSNILDET